MKLAMIAMFALAGVASAAPMVSVDVAENLADAANPIPTVSILNDSKSPIEIQIFGGTPLTILEPAAPDGTFERHDPHMCGNGFTAHRIAPGEYVFYPLWQMVDHGPGKTGTYRVVLPYTIISGSKKREAELVSEPFELAYGDVAPRDRRDAAHPGRAVVVSAEGDHASALGQLSPSALATKLLPTIDKCVASAQKRLPWLRGRFSLVVYQPNDRMPTLYVSASLLGDEAVNKCLGAIAVVDTIEYNDELTFAVSPPTP